MVAFLRRNLILKTHRAKKIDSKRVSSGTTAIIKSWFDHLRIPAGLAISSENRCNMDKTGVMEGQGTNGLVVGDRRSCSTQKKQTWISYLDDYRGVYQRRGPNQAGSTTINSTESSVQYF